MQLLFHSVNEWDPGGLRERSELVLVLWHAGPAGRGAAAEESRRLVCPEGTGPGTLSAVLMGPLAQLTT